MKKEAKKKNKKDLKEHKLTDWLPTTKKEVELRGWDDLDVILFSGDAYVDHPSFGPAVIGRLLEAQGLRVAIVPQPNWRDDLRDFKKCFELLVQVKFSSSITLTCTPAFLLEYLIIDFSPLESIVVNQDSFFISSESLFKRSLSAPFAKL